MFHNSRKTIGVFLERSASEFQKIAYVRELLPGQRNLVIMLLCFPIMVIMDRTTAILSEIRHCGNCRLTKS